MQQSINQIKRNERVGRKCEAACADCNRVTSHEILTSLDLSGDADDGQIRFWEHHDVIQCRGCTALSFRKVHVNTECEEWDPQTRQLVPAPTVELFPTRVDGCEPIEQADDLPIQVFRMYEETLTALGTSSVILASVGIRSLVESVCRDRGCNGDDLQEQIGDLVVQGILSSRDAERLQLLRVMGNKAAHQQKPHDAKELVAAFKIAEHLLRTVYLIPAVAAGLGKR